MTYLASSKEHKLSPASAEQGAAYIFSQKVTPIFAFRSVQILHLQPLFCSFTQLQGTRELALVYG